MVHYDIFPLIEKLKKFVGYGVSSSGRLPAKLVWPELLAIQNKIFWGDGDVSTKSSSRCPPGSFLGSGRHSNPPFPAVAKILEHRQDFLPYSR